MAKNSVANLQQAANEIEASGEISPLSKELVIGLVGYAGAGSSTTAKRLHMLLDSKGYKVEPIKLSKLIADQWPSEKLPAVKEGPTEGKTRLERARKLQDLGDKVRERHQCYAVAALAVRKIRELRGSAKPGFEKIAFIVESLKHKDEVELLRRVYDTSFRLVAVHCERTTRESRLIGGNLTDAKYKGADRSDVLSFMDRDEKDGKNPFGQQVRDAFYLADYFIDNNAHSASSGASLNSGIDRFLNLLLGSGLVRPTAGERAIYHAHSAALQSSCLSRQVGAVLVSASGEVVATGTNDVPRFGGGVYDEGSRPDNRCHAWVWEPEGQKFRGCHNDRKKNTLRKDIANWFANNLSGGLAEAAHPVPQGLDTAKKARDAARAKIEAYLLDQSDKMSEMPGVKDLIEYSRAIHAEMSAVLAAARSGVSTVGSTLYCTTYPCHNCARHLVAAGVHHVSYIEPYVKSLASELHSDAIVNEMPKPGTSPTKMVIAPFTGVGPRMYEDLFAKRVSLKGAGGVFIEPEVGVPSHAVRLLEMDAVEEFAAGLIPGA